MRPSPGVVGDGTAHHALAAATQAVWARFARSGNPNQAGLPESLEYDLQTRSTMIFDTVCHVATDPAGAEGRDQAPPLRR